MNARRRGRAGITNMTGTMHSGRLWCDMGTCVTHCVIEVAACCDMEFIEELGQRPHYQKYTYVVRSSTVREHATIPSISRAGSKGITHVAIG
jgi:hypothetical protein